MNADFTERNLRRLWPSLLKKARIMKSLLPVAAFVFLLIFLWGGLRRDPHKLPSPLIGKRLPVFDMTLLKHSGDRVTDRDFRGHLSLLNVWATWCISCRAEHPIIMDIARSHAVHVVGLNYKDTRPRALKWLRGYGDPYEMTIFDPQGRLGIDLGVYGTPESYLIDSQGVIRYKYTGPISPYAWKHKVLPMIQRLKHEEA